VQRERRTGGAPGPSPNFQQLQANLIPDYLLLKHVIGSFCFACLERLLIISNLPFAFIDESTALGRSQPIRTDCTRPESAV
jgi:hypothetical protein